MTTQQEQGIQVRTSTGDDTDKLLAAQLTHKTMDIGILGKFFWSPDYVPTSVVGFLVVAFVLTISGMLLFKPLDPQTDPFKYLFPMIGTAIGYLFGKKTSADK